MKSFTKFTAYFLLLFAATGAFAQGQKGVDKQTETIRDTGDNSNRGSKAERTWNFGKDKTKVRERLANPYKFTARRDGLIQNITFVLEEKRIVFDEAASRPKDGIIVTQPFTFSKGVVLTTQELNRYAIVPMSQNNWTRGRYTLIIEIASVDGTSHNVSVTAKVEGRNENPIGAEWISLRSNGEAEEEFLTKLVEAVTGISPDDKLKAEEENTKDNR